MYLLLDIGNTRIKAGLCDLSFSRWQVIYFNLKQLPENIQCIMVSCVGQTEQLQQLQQLAQQHNIPFYLLKTQSQQLGIRCAYPYYQTLGIDRWLAVLAASQYFPQQQSIIVDAGTAATIDFLDHQQHLGGWILPGLSLMQQSTLNNTEQVFMDEHTQVSLTWRDNTADGLQTGCFTALLGSIKLAQQQLPKAQLLLSGGDRFFLQPHLPEAIIYDNLVLDGLLQVARHRLNSA